MNPLSKFAVFLTLAGVLAVLFTFVPGHRPIITLPAQPAGDPPARKPSPEAPTDPAREPAPAGAKSRAIIGPGNVATADPRVTVPAIRGLNRYGWVQLPMGTRVELVRQDATSLLVRWDGTLTRLPHEAVRRGAVVVVPRATL